MARDLLRRATKVGAASRHKIFAVGSNPARGRSPVPLRRGRQWLRLRLADRPSIEHRQWVHPLASSNGFWQGFSGRQVSIQGMFEGGAKKPVGCVLMRFLPAEVCGRQSGFDDACGRRKGHISAFVGNDADDGKLVIAVR